MSRGEDEIAAGIDLKGRLSSRVHIEAQKGGDKHIQQAFGVKGGQACSIERVVCTVASSVPEV